MFRFVEWHKELGLRKGLGFSVKELDFRLSLGLGLWVVRLAHGI